MASAAGLQASDYAEYELATKDAKQYEESQNENISENAERRNFLVDHNYRACSQRGLKDTKMSNKVIVSIYPNNRDTMMSRFYCSTTSIMEEGPAYADDDLAPPLYEHSDLLQVPDRESRESMIKIEKAQEELQGALEFFRKHQPGKKQLLDRGSTNLLEPSKCEGCQYCSLKHRNGDCLLSRVETHLKRK